MEPTAPFRRSRAPGAGIPTPSEQYLEALEPNGVPRDLTPGVVRRASDGLSERAVVVAPIIVVAPEPQATLEPEPPPVLESLLAPEPEEARPITPVDFCREARRLRAVMEDDPVRMHQELGKLTMGPKRDGPKVEQRPAATEEPEPQRKTTPLRWPWLRTARVGKRGMTWLGKQMSAEVADDAPPKPDPEDGQPRHTLVDPDDPLPIDEGYPSSQDRSFSELVLRKLHGRRRGVLRYSERLELLKEAGRRGIGRFEANLIIASVQHRLKLTVPECSRRRRPLKLSGVIAFLALQGLILWGMWRVLKT
jgi:hypothetical protein